MDLRGASMSVVVGRERELAAVGGLLDGVAVGPATLALSGVAGIGKTTVWQAGVDSAFERGFTVLACRASSAEVRLSYAGLADLLAPVDAEVFERLAVPQRRALDAALLRGTVQDATPDPRAVAAGVLSVLDTMARAGPLVVAIDDLQWLDEPTRRIVTFAVRRCAGPVAVLTATRTGDDTAPVADLSPRDPDRKTTLEVGPLSLAALHHVITHKLDRRLPRPALARIAEVSGGNPFYAVELARSIDPAAPDLNHLPASLRRVVADRLGALDPAVRHVLLIAAALAAPRVDLVEQALSATDATQLLGVAEDAGVISLAPDGTITFTHPLLAAGITSDSTPSQRRALHRRLSGIVDDIEERARHLALAALGPDPDTVTALDTAAEAARSRGAPAAAAELLELAIDLGATDPHRRARAAKAHFHAGDPARAQLLLEDAVDDLDPEGLGLLGTIRFEVQGDDGAVTLLEQAFSEASGDPGLRCSVALELSNMLFASGRLTDSLAVAGEAVAEAERAGDDGMLAEALAATVATAFLLGHEINNENLARALRLEDPDRQSRANSWPTLLTGLVYRWSHRLEDARSAFAAARRRCLDHGAESELWLVSANEIPVACATGDVEGAAQLVDELREWATMLGTEETSATALLYEEFLHAWEGRVDSARAAAHEAMTLFGTERTSPVPLLVHEALAMAELSVGNHEAAAQCLQPTLGAAASLGLGQEHGPESTLADQLGWRWIFPDAAEALIGLGRLDEAEPLVELLEASGGRPTRAWAAAVGARCRGLLRAAQRDPDAATAAFDRALAAHDQLPQLRYDRARTLLALARHQRRTRQRRAAHASLEEAAALFDSVGARQWAATTRDELARLGLKPGDSNELTPTEAHVAELAATGMTVRDVAAALIVSPKTVEAHLTRIYRKLGIHTRAELARHMAGQL